MNQPALIYKGPLFYIYDVYHIVNIDNVIQIQKIGDITIPKRSQALAFKEARHKFGKSVSNVILRAKKRKIKKLSATDPDVQEIVKNKGVEEEVIIEL